MLIDEALDVAREVAREVLVADAAAVDREARWPEAGIRALLRRGLGGLVVPVEAGGSGLGTHAVARVCEILGQQCSSTGISFGMHMVGSAVMSANPQELQRQRFLEPIARGEHITTLALSEPGTGVHFYLPETQARRRGDRFALTGTKTFVTNGGRADSYVVSAVAAEADEPAQFSCFVVEAGMTGLRWGEPWAGWGMRGNSAISMTLEDVELPASNLLGREGDEVWYVFHVIAPHFIAAMSGTYLGIAAAALDEALAHVGSRSHSHTASPLASNSILQHKLGELWGQVERTRALIHTATQKVDTGAPDALPAIFTAKAEVAECADEVCAAAMTLLGGRGYAGESRIQRLYRDARAAHVMAPTTELLRLWTARALLGVPLLGS